jgi:hypothetical protein
VVGVAIEKSPKTILQIYCIARLGSTSEALAVLAREDQYYASSNHGQKTFDVVLALKVVLESLVDVLQGIVTMSNKRQRLNGL